MNKNIIKKILHEGLMLPYKKREPITLIQDTLSRTAEVPNNIAEQLEKDGIIQWVRDINGWMMHEKNMWMIKYYEKYKKLPPKYDDFPYYYITPGHNVIVDDDEFGEFQASIASLNNDFVTIVDGEDNYYDYEPEKIRYYEV